MLGGVGDHPFDFDAAEAPPLSIFLRCNIGKAVGYTRRRNGRVATPLVPQTSTSIMQQSCGQGRTIMRPFLVACLAFVVIGAGGYFALNAVQKPSGEAFTTEGTRIDPDWSWRSVLTTLPPQSCEPRKPWQWFFVDLRDPRGESSLCSVSQ